MFKTIEKKQIWNIGVFLMRIFFFLCFQVLLVAFTEYASSGSIDAVIGLVTGNVVTFLFSCSLVLLVSSVFFLLIGAYSFFVSFTLFFLLATISFYKNKILNDYLFPTDIFVFGGSSGNLVKFVHVELGMNLVFAFLGGLLIAGAYFYFFREARWRWYVRLALVPLLLACSTYVFANENFRLHTVRQILSYNIDDMAWRQKYNYEHNGFITAFYINLGNIYVKKPSGYSKQKIDAIVKWLDPVKLAQNTEKPDVIFILSEAFWDITKIPGISFETDPLINFHRLAKESTTGDLISPTYGGKTEWVEFEALTGNMMKFLPFGSMPYEQYIKKPIPALPWEFKKNGYETYALHTYEKTFFNRYKAYPFLGFDTFIWVEDLVNPEYKWPFVSDNEFAGQIIYKLEHKKSDSIFLFGITMQNHFSYEGEKYPKIDIHLTTDLKLSPKSRRILENYGQGLSDADKSLGKIISYLQKREKPTVLVFFWDHLGSLGDKYETYKETRFLKSQNEADWNQEDLLKMYSTEFVIWNNFWLKKENPGRIGSSYLGNYLLDMLGFTHKNPYFDFISREFNQCIVADSTKTFIDREGNVNTPNTLKPECKESEQDHRLLQYDIIFGKEYSQK